MKVNNNHNKIYQLNIESEMTKVSENTLICTIFHSIIKGSILVGDIACLKIILSSCRCAHTFAAHRQLVRKT